jgi:hypothetical protein
LSNYNHGHKTDDDLFILYKGIKVPVTRVDWSGRKGTLTDSLEVITLVNGKRLVPSHFRYGFAEVPGNWLHWRMKLSYPAWMLKEIMLATNTLLASIPKDDTWKGAYLPIPFKDHDR